MPNEEEQQRRSRVVVETPHVRREVEHVYAERTPENKGYSTATVAGVALVAIAVAALIVFFLFNSGSNSADNTNINARVTTATAPTPLPTVNTTPVQTSVPPVMQPAPIIVTPPAATTTTPVAAPSSAPTPRQPDDTTIQANVSKKFLDDPELSSADVTATVGGGKVILTGTVATQALKNRAEKLAKTVKGVTVVENKINVQNANANVMATP
jgi:uncharacterized secreted protein with C-terminal beta-propeller domain